MESVELIPIETLEDKAARCASLSYAPQTAIAYSKILEHFNTWCESHGLSSLPADPQTIAKYLADHSDHWSVATLALHLAAISKSHQWLGFDNPASMSNSCVSLVWKGIKNKNGIAPKHVMQPLFTDQIRAMVKSCVGPTGRRDAALLLLGFAGAFRRSEIVGLNVGDIQFHELGMTVFLARSKTDQVGKGRKVGIPWGNATTCPVTQMRAYLEDHQDPEKPLFPSGRSGAGRLTPQTVRLIVRRACRAAGIPEEYSAHSLRAGFVTQSIRGGASDHAIMDQTGHRDSAMVRRYRREAELFRDNAAGRLGL